MKYILPEIILIASAVSLAGADLPGIPRDSNFNNTGGYDATKVEARLILGIKDTTKVVHFIRDNNDPRVVTKTYHLKNVDAYEFRDYIRQMVQAKRVGNTSLEQQYPLNASVTAAATGTTTFNAASSAGNVINPNGNAATVNTVQGVTATVSSPVITTPVSAQNTYNPQAQLGSNTAVECLKYVDGTGLLLISAEEYRFKDHENGWGFDHLVEFLDKPQMGANFGTQTFFYIPKFVPARNLMPLIENVGMNIADISELWQGMDLVAYDPDLNYLIFDVTNYSMFNIEKMLAKYDVPIPQVRMNISVYEIDTENDDKMGLDFQAWKNNEGADFFSAGGRYRDNWSAMYGGTMGQSGAERTSFYNFNPKWNTRYIDFLVSKGKAKIAHSGELAVRNNTSGLLDMRTQIFYMDMTKSLTAATNSPDMGVGYYELLSTIVNRLIPVNDIPVAKANQQNVLSYAGFGFMLTVNNASVNLDETRLNLTLTNSSLLGFASNGVPRISNNQTSTLDVSLPLGKNSFVIGGLRKQNTVKSSSGIPWLKDIPYIGYLFKTESTSIKDYELVIVGQCIWDSPSDKPEHPAKSKSLTR